MAKGSGFTDAVSHEYIADDVNIGLYGPVILVDPADETKLPKVGSTTTGGHSNVIGVCVAKPASGIITAGTSIVMVVVQGRTKLKVATAAVAINDPLETGTAVGVAQVQVDPTVDATSVVTLAADVVIVANNIRKCFAVALSASSNANSIIAVYVNINTCRGNVT